ncbi:MFS transporter [Litorihabitans aurantiacus]|uniref:MFS transporter n=1 Tax=Litorihabitans aurantiacus TaxID=1930061 RepID=A0AA37UGU9_9MICO|nr:MFS transporter [Litorihabitans aurantiacus]GMA30408.1 MFS transporter [Litorihabitans aurantiacus]
MSTTFASLRHPAYRIWFAGALVANIGTWMQRVAQDWVVLTELSDHSGVAVGVVTALQFLPALLISPYAGLLADRLPRRAMLMATQGAMGVLAAALGVMILTDVVELWHVYVFALLLGVASAMDAPVRQTFVAELVPADGLPNAVGLNSASFNAARLIGPAVAGFAIAAIGAGWVFVANAITFAFTIGALLLIRDRDRYPLAHAPRGKGQLREGVDYVRRRTDIVLILVVLGVVGALGLNFQLTSAVMATTIFDKGSGEYGLLGSILAIGSLAGSLLAARRTRPRVRLVLLAALGFGVASGLMAMAPTYELYALAAIPTGFCTLTMLTAANAYVQMSTAPEMRGRVMSLYLMVFLGTTPLGSPLVGWVAEAWGARWSVGIGSIASILIALAAMWWARKAWHVELRYVRGPRRRVMVLSDADRVAEAA